VYCSPATLELCRVLLPDSAHLHEEDARFANTHGFSKHKPALPLYTSEDAEGCLALFRTIQPGRSFEPLAGVTAQLRCAGHVLGASFVRLEQAGVSITFSGDLGRPQDVLMKPPAAPSRTDYLVIESTYGDRRHPAIDPAEELGQWLRKACARGGVTVIPTFAVGRAQALLWQIACLKAEGRIPDVPVFLDSPMAVDVTALYRIFHHEHRLDEAGSQRMCAAAAFVNSVEQSKALDARQGPMIVLSAAGMATGGRVLHHLKAFIGESRNLVLFAGYQAPGTRGAALVAGAGKLRIHGHEYPVKAEVAQLEASSSHADADELLAWMRQLPAAPRQVFVTHGEAGASDALRYRIEHELGWTASVPEYRESVELT
jgi:metallo-beta-lactamase family protein